MPSHPSQGVQVCVRWLCYESYMSYDIMHDESLAMITVIWQIVVKELDKPTILRAILLCG